MDFLNLFHFVEYSDTLIIPHIKENKITTNIDKFNSCIFSIGTYEKNSFEQTFYPLKKKPTENSIILSIDPEYSSFKPQDVLFIESNNSNTASSSDTSLTDNQIKFNHLFSIHNIHCYYDFEKNIEFYIIPYKIDTDYPMFRGEAAESFEFSRDCSTTSMSWHSFYIIIQNFIKMNKNIYINNWAFTNSRYFKLVNGVHKPFYRDIGHFFEYFPEMGFILNQLYGCWSNRYKISIHITTYNLVCNKMTIKQIQDTELSKL